eukprot:Selendium_serpulae@DN4828_c0_g1_i1.p1
MSRPLDDNFSSGLSFGAMGDPDRRSSPPSRASNPNRGVSFGDHAPAYPVGGVGPGGGWREDSQAAPQAASGLRPQSNSTVPQNWRSTGPPPQQDTGPPSGAVPRPVAPQSDGAPAAGSSEPGSNAWRPGRHTLDEEEKLSREVNGLLNKLTIERFPTVAERLAFLVENVSSDKALNAVVTMTVEKAVTEPQFSETYADLCEILKWRSPTNIGCLDAKQSQTAFSKALIENCQRQFQNMPRTLTLTEEDKATLASSGEDEDYITKKKKTRMLGVTRLIGELTVRQMLSIQISKRVAHQLLFAQDQEEHLVECMCQLFVTTGYYMDGKGHSDLLNQWECRLKELCASGDCSKRLHIMIQDILETRERKWAKKVHKGRPKGLNQLKEEFERAAVVGGTAIAAQRGQVVVVGTRVNLENEAYSDYYNHQKERYSEKTKKI